MRGYEDSTYGERFADVYDDWYGDVTDVDATVARIAELAAAADPAPIVELGVGTGRVAVPLAHRVAPLVVHGVDASEAMLTALAAKSPPANLVAIHGDMVDALGPSQITDGPLGVVFATFNTFFNLPSAQRQQACFDAVAARLAPNGRIVVEAFVPDPSPSPSVVDVRSISADRVVLHVSATDAAQQIAHGQFIEITESSGVTLRPWRIRYAPPAELDAMAAAAGLCVDQRWRSFAGDRYDDDSDRHVTVYQHDRAGIGADD